MSEEIRQAVIMVGGKGTRLRPLTESIPKPLLPVLGRPCVEYVIRRLAESGIREVILACGYRSDSILEAIGDGSRYGLRVDFAYEDEPAGTAGSVKLIEDRLDDSFVVASGDVLADVDIAAMVREHRRSGAMATMALTRVEDPSEFGIVGLGPGGEVERFREKPSPAEVFSDLINAGIYVLERGAMALVPAGEMHDFSKDLFPEMMRRGERIQGHVLSGFWMDIGRPRDLLAANLSMARSGGEVHPGALEGGEARGACHIMPGASLRHAVVSDSVVHPGAVLEGCRVERSLVLEDAYIGEGSLVTGSIVGRGAELSGGVSLDDEVLPDGGVRASERG